MTSFADCLARQRGVAASGTVFDPTPRYIRNGRDLAEWLHRDFTLQAGVNAALMLLSPAFGPAVLDAGNPYLTSLTQGSFVTFGPPHLLDLVARVANAALRAAWYQKWLVHRRVRPESFGARVHSHVTGAAASPIHPELLDSAAVAAVFSAHGTYLLPMAYAEGCPAHPAYPAGHAAFIGGCVTVLKAFFKESFVMPAPVVASGDGLTLTPYSGPDLTVGGELNKLAANIALGRDTAGVHWRTDGIEGLGLGEAVAIGVLQDLRTTYTEEFSGFSLTRFDGTTVTL
jgi:membrane-associated phospholipid phosphatase